MTDNEIIKALTVCSSAYFMCHDCPYFAHKGDCVNEMKNDAIDLIKRQQEMIEALIAGQETLRKHFVEEKDKIVEQLEAESRFYNSASDNDQLIRQGVNIAVEIVKGVQNE